MKKKFLTIACIAGILSVSVISAKAEISQKALQSFRSVFAEAKQVRWTEYPDCYYVSFLQNDMQVKVTYDKDGNLLNSTRYYKEQRLPIAVLSSVKSAYPSKKISLVTEVSSTEGTVYFIQLKDENGFTIVKSNEQGLLEVTDKFKKID